MATASVAFAALAGTAALTAVEVVARRLASRATRSSAATLATVLAVCLGASLVVAALGTIRLEGSVGLLAGGVTCVALVAALLIRLGGPPTT